jgi:hypothetical protein
VTISRILGGVWTAELLGERDFRVNHRASVNRCEQAGHLLHNREAGIIVLTLEGCERGDSNSHGLSATGS